MTAFNFDPGSDIHIDTNGDELLIHFDGDTFGINKTTSGFSFTNDWNKRHFSLAFDQNSILYHVTREDDDDRKSGKRGVSPEEFVAEIYGYVRSLAPPVPKDQLPFDFVGRADMEEMHDYLKDKRVVLDTDVGLQVDTNRRAELGETLNNHPAALGKLYQRVLHPVPVEDAINPKSGENIFIYPTPNALFVLFMFPDQYIGVTTAHQVLEFADVAGGSQIIDHVLRSMSRQ